jgi:hypothetical protein
MKSIPYSHLLLRATALAGIIALAYLTPWWLPCICMAVCMLRSGWYELVLVGVVLDVLLVSFGTTTPLFGPFTAGSCLVALCVWYLRMRMRSVAY